MGTDAINPSHYKGGWSNGAEVIDIVENLGFNAGNAIKYLARAGRKDPTKHLEDLKRAAWYVQREIERVDIAQLYADWDSLPDPAEWNDEHDQYDDGEEDGELDVDWNELPYGPNGRHCRSSRSSGHIYMAPLGTKIPTTNLLQKGWTQIGHMDIADIAPITKFDTFNDNPEAAKLQREIDEHLAKLSKEYSIPFNLITGLDETVSVKLDDRWDGLGQRWVAGIHPEELEDGYKLLAEETGLPVDLIARTESNDTEALRAYDNYVDQLVRDAKAQYPTEVKEEDVTDEATRQFKNDHADRIGTGGMDDGSGEIVINITPATNTFNFTASHAIRNLTSYPHHYSLNSNY